MRVKPENKGMSSIQQETPEPRGGFTGGDPAFSVLRTLDSHIPSTLGDPNCHYPNATDGIGADFHLDDNLDFGDTNAYNE